MKRLEICKGTVYVISFIPPFQERMLDSQSAPLKHLFMIIHLLIAKNLQWTVGFVCKKNKGTTIGQCESDNTNGGSQETKVRAIG